VSKIEVKKLQEVKVIVQHNGPVYTFKWRNKKSMTYQSEYADTAFFLFCS
jgi:hypothetical protein